MTRKLPFGRTGSVAELQYASAWATLDLTTPLRLPKLSVGAKNASAKCGHRKRYWKSFVCVRIGAGRPALLGLGLNPAKTRDLN